MDQDINILSLYIRERDRIVFEGAVESFSANNLVGKFDVLPRHSNFISLVNGILTYRPKGGESIDLEVANGVLKVEKNRAEVYLGFKRT